MAGSVHDAALEALLVCGLEEKTAAVGALGGAWRAGCLRAGADGEMRKLPVIFTPGRPDRPTLVPPREVPRRRASSRAGHLALLHAIAHIEFNAINLALDCVYRFQTLPDEFYAAWIQVAEEEACHFGLVRERLQALGHDYGDFPAHDGLWEMACKTADDPLARMALVPRVLEARGLDATPPIMAKLRAIGDAASVAVLEIILRDEVGHVALGDHWFRQFCRERGLEPETTYLRLVRESGAPWPAPPLNLPARRQAGFGEGELARLSAGAPD
jgi:uncharacterized ferritin-like protein (DUF455 family)